MQKVYSSPMGKRSLFYRHAVNGYPYRGWGLHNIALYPLIKLKYPFKHNESFLVDELIIGSNPILNLIMLSSLAQNAFNKQKHIKAGVLKLQDADYWAYHQLNKEYFWHELKSKTDKVPSYINSVEDFISFIIKNTRWDYLDIIFIENNDYQIQYFRQDTLSNLICFHLIDNKKHNDGVFSELIPTVIQSENKIKQIIADNISNQINKIENSFQLKWSNCLQQSTGNSEKSHILIASHIYLTSLPYQWLNIATVKENQYSCFNHAFSSLSLGSAKKIANDFLSLEHLALIDIIEAFNFPVGNI